ncbi:hypothetical protein RvY_12611 [Ramazzottius varieornatus]|uniref:Uncharacterized protein n=1 Tax=Ramazzottius varieornatus TaxID=947166 RepID=A0A1D1VTT8_RAMVA|nr:hypothetical protein RvY_12611 [Ramazzottius varieornatus]
MARAALVTWYNHFKISLTPLIYLQNLTAFVQQQAAIRIRNFVFPRTYFVLSDIFYAQRQHGIPLPPWVTPSVEKDINFLSDLWSVYMLGGVNRTAESANKRIKLHGGKLLRTIMEVLTRKVNGSTLDSSHDENIGVTSSAFGLYPFRNKDTPGHIGYASAIVWELFNNDSARIVFKKKRPEEPMGNPDVLVHPECAEFCPLAKLLQLSMPYFMSEGEWLQRCHTPTVPKGPTEAAKYDIDNPNA